MPARTTPLVTGKIYHVLNRGNASVPIFRDKRDYQRFMDTFLYYQHKDVPIRFSQLLNLNKVERETLLSNVKKKPKQIAIIVFCLMPNHFHFLLKQLEAEGIYNFIRQFINSYSHYFNLRHKRKGSLFEGRFRAVRVETEEQLLHLSRYIHLNPYSSLLVRDLKQLSTYPYSSSMEFLDTIDEGICQKDDILSYFPEKGDYREFVFDRADYQRSLEEIKHKLLEKEILPECNLFFVPGT